QVAIRRHGEHLESVILAGVEGLDQTYKLPRHMDTHMRRLAVMVRADPAVARDVPDLHSLCARVMAKLEREPMIVSARHPVTGETVSVPVGAFGLALILRFDMGDASDLPVFPKLLHSIEQDDPSILTWFVSKRLRMLASLSGMTAITDGASGVGEGRMAMIERQASSSLFGDACNYPWPDLGEAWGAHDLGDEYRQPLVSDVRTLLLSGTLDWNTPPFQAEQLRWGLTNATHIIVENAGHEQVLPHPEVQEAIVKFLAGKPVQGRTVQAPPVRFVPIHGRDPQRTHPSLGG
ncbi:MAG: alpha/beta hydrolase, partial [Planctomycetota bacterium]